MRFPFFVSIQIKNPRSHPRGRSQCPVLKVSDKNAFVHDRSLTIIQAGLFSGDCLGTV